MKTKIITILLSILLVISIAFNIYQFQAVDTLKSQCTTLQSDIENLNNEINSLNDTISSNEDEIATLSSEKADLSSGLFDTSGGTITGADGYNMTNGGSGAGAGITVY
jgi:peptidoglycan hydrolase CwlO-like protein